MSYAAELESSNADTIGVGASTYSPASSAPGAVPARKGGLKKSALKHGSSEQGAGQGTAGTDTATTSVGPVKLSPQEMFRIVVCHKRLLSHIFSMCYS
jgi:hypothetical protein